MKRGVQHTQTHIPTRDSKLAERTNAQAQRALPLLRQDTAISALVKLTLSSFPGTTVSHTRAGTCSPAQARGHKVETRISPLQESEGVPWFKGGNLDGLARV